MGCVGDKRAWGALGGKAEVKVAGKGMGLRYRLTGCVVVPPSRRLKCRPSVVVDGCQNGQSACEDSSSGFATPPSSWATHRFFVLKLLGRGLHCFAIGGELSYVARGDNRVASSAYSVTCEYRQICWPSRGLKL